jgi:hypothetical protein
VSVFAEMVPQGVRAQLGLFDQADIDEPTMPAPDPRTRYTVQICRSFFEMKRGRTITHGRSIAHAYDNRRDPETFCGKPWRHAEHNYVYFDVVANVDRDRGPQADLVCRLPGGAPMTAVVETIGVSCGHRVPRVPVIDGRRKLYWCDECGEHRMSGGKTTGERGFDWLLELRDDIADSQASGQTILLEASEPLAEHNKRLMDTLGVPVIVKRDVAGKRDVTTRRANTPRAAAAPTPKAFDPFQVADGTEIVLVAGVPKLWHLPAPGDESTDRKTLCSLKGHLWVAGTITRGRRCCTVCAARTAKGIFLPPPRPPRRSNAGSRAVPKFTDAQVDLFERIYLEKQIGVPAIAGLVWEKLGFRNATSCANAITRAFKERGVELRPRAASHRRTVEAQRFLGVGGTKPGEQRLTGPILDRLYELYKAGVSVPELAAEHAAPHGYDDTRRFRHVVEYGWKVSGHQLRSNREAELLSRKKIARPCLGVKSAANLRHGKAAGERCTQRAVDGSEYCFAHDPEREQERAATVSRLHEGRPRAEVLWSVVLPHLAPLLETRLDRLGRKLEKPGGALARHTGVPPGTCSRLMKGRKEAITVKLANRLLAPLGLTVDEIRSGEAIAA